MTDAVIVAQEVWREYRSEGVTHPAVREVSLTVGRGEFVAIMGQSGSGKSTLLNLLGGIDKPDRGQVTVGGVALQNAGETALARFRRQHVGIVFQFFNLIHNLDVAANIELPGLLGGEPTAAVRRRAQELMAALQIEHLGAKMVTQLSGGQRQRVAIARALINRPTLLLADEPTGALDQETGEAVLRLLRELHGQGQTIVMVTHDPKVAAYAQRVLIMADGLLREQPSTGHVGGRIAQQLLGVRG